MHRRVPAGRSRSHRGMALVVALLALLVLSILGTTLLVVTRTDETVSRGYASEVDALFAANAGLQVGIRNAMVDAMCDPRGGWSDSIIAIGCDQIVPSPLPAGSHVDVSGAVTGVPGSVYVDAADFLPTPPGCATSAGGAGCDAATWARTTLGEPFAIDGDDLSPPVAPRSSDLGWTRNGPGASTTPSWLPNGGAYRLRFIGVPDGDCSGSAGACAPYRSDYLRIVATGLAGTPIEGLHVGFDGPAGVAQRAVREVIATFKVRDIGIWTNAFFADSASAEIYQGGATLRGSLHIRNRAGIEPGFAVTGNASIRNNYAGVDEAYVMGRVPVPAGSPHGLGAELRLREGTLHIQGSASSVGTATDEASRSSFVTDGKGPMDGIFIGSGGPQFSGSSADDHHEELLAEYDAGEWELPTPDYDAADYRDRCNTPYATTGGLPGFQKFLKGVAGTTDGVHALDLTPLGSDLEIVRGATLAIAVDAARGAIVAANDDEFPGTPRTPPGTSDGNMDLLVDPATGIVGVFKHLPAGGAPEGNPSCLYAAEGGGHGFLYIPAGVSVPAGAGAADITRFIDRNMGRYDPTLARDGVRPNADVNRFLGRPVDAADSDAIGDAAVPAFPEDIVDASFGRLLLHGVVYTENHHISIGGSCGGSSDACGRGSIVYMGSGTFAAGDSSGPMDRDVRFWADHLLAYRSFPCSDVLGVMAPDEAALSGPGAPGLELMAAVYGRNLVSLQQNVAFTGSYVTAGSCGGCYTGNGIEHTQVPALSHCLPPRMIGNWSFFVTRTVAWSER